MKYVIKDRKGKEHGDRYDTRWDAIIKFVNPPTFKETERLWKNYTALGWKCVEVRYYE